MVKGKIICNACCLCAYSHWFTYHWGTYVAGPCAYCRHTEFHSQFWSPDSSYTCCTGSLITGTINCSMGGGLIYICSDSRKQFHYTNGSEKIDQHSPCPNHHCAIDDSPTIGWVGPGSCHSVNDPHHSACSG